MAPPSTSGTGAGVGNESIVAPPSTSGPGAGVGNESTVAPPSTSENWSGVGNESIVAPPSSLDPNGASVSGTIAPASVDVPVGDSTVAEEFVNVLGALGTFASFVTALGDDTGVGVV